MNSQIVFLLGLLLVICMIIVIYFVAKLARVDGLGSNDENHSNPPEATKTEPTIHWRDLVHIKLAKVFGDDGESLNLVLYCLKLEEQECKDSDSISPTLRILRQSLDSDEIFKVNATKLLTFDESTHKCNNSSKLAPVNLCENEINDIRRWWNRQISDRKMKKKIVDNVVFLGEASYFIAIGSILGPIGMVFGGVIGTIIGQTSKPLVSSRTQRIFEMSKVRAVKNAYSYLGVTKYSCNHKINHSFRRLCFKHDKDGDMQEFQLLQNHMAVIKAVKGEL